jgi:hypothetical protein
MLVIRLLLVSFMVGAKLFPLCQSLDSLLTYLFFFKKKKKECVML